MRSASICQHEGRVVDLGCGFGLCTMRAFVRASSSKAWISIPEGSLWRRSLPEDSVSKTFAIESVTSWTFVEANSTTPGYMLDIVHHNPARAVRPCWRRSPRRYRLGAVVGQGCRPEACVQALV